MKGKRGGNVMKRLLVKLVRSDDGQDLIEYGLLVGIITVGAIATISLIGPKVKGYFDTLNGAMP
jgi:pilus assembly protein Flp/PilA